MINEIEIRHFHFFCGLGGGAKGFNKGRAQVGNLSARFRCIGGIDNDPAAIADFGKLAGVPGTLMDLFTREQYEAFHGLTLRGVWLALEAWKDDPPELIVFENVPRIMKRGRHLLDQIIALLRAYGYAVAETTHDCGEIGGLAQSRKRFLLVARHEEKVPPFLYEPPKRALRGVPEVIISPVREHSRKPDAQYPRIERYCAGPRLEMFARQRRPGWDVFGNQVDRFQSESSSTQRQGAP